MEVAGGTMTISRRAVSETQLAFTSMGREPPCLTEYVLGDRVGQRYEKAVQPNGHEESQKNWGIQECSTRAMENKTFSVIPRHLQQAAVLLANCRLPPKEVIRPD